MGFRFRTSVKIALGVRLNVGSKSVGVSAGVRGARISTNTRTGTRATVGIPGSGLSYSTRIGGGTRKSSSAIVTPINIDASATSVQVSANTIVWPCLCPCYGVRFNPPVGSTQVGAGVYSIKVAVNTFSPAYCQQCLNHQKALQEAEALAPVPEAGAFWGCMAPILFVLWFILAVGFGSMIVALGAAFVFVLLGRELRKNLAKQQGDKELERDALVEQAQKMQKSDCSCAGPAVALIESHGSLRRFAFVNPKLAAIFAQLNASKIVH